MNVLDITSWDARSRSPTPMMDRSVEAFTISAAVLTQVGRICRIAWGNNTLVKVWENVRPMALAASIWPLGIACRAPRTISPTCTAEHRQCQHACLKWAELDTRGPQDVVAREHENQHRRAPNEVRVAAQQGTQWASAIRETQADRDTQKAAGQN